MVNDKVEAWCYSFLLYFQMFITCTGAAPALFPLEAIATTVPPLSTELLYEREQLIQYHFPSLNRNLAAMQQIQIATQIGNFTQ